MLCLVYVVVALLHGGLKLVLNVYRGSVSEAANQRLRLQMNPATAGSASAAALGRGRRQDLDRSSRRSRRSAASSARASAEPLLNGGILLSVFGYMLFMQPWMALVALLIFCPQLLFIPFLQEAINRRTKRRIETLRALTVDIVNEARRTRRRARARRPSGAASPMSIG